MHYSIMEYKIRPVLVVIDIQNSFMSTGGSFDKMGYDISKYHRVIPIIQELYKKAKSLKIPVIFSQAIREKSGVDLVSRLHKILPKKRRERIKKVPICIRDTWDADIIKDIKPQDEDFVVEKRRDSIFQDTEFELWLKSLKADTLIFTGVDTSICVESSLRDGFNKGWDVILLSDATASLNDDFYDGTVAEVKENFGLVMKSEEVLSNLEKIGTNKFLLKVDD
ncbi:MAG: cysteine hydrolase, partial [archaeon]|nr:cysteine hydrolase [archaeon]